MRIGLWSIFGLLVLNVDAQHLASPMLEKIPEALETNPHSAQGHRTCAMQQQFICWILRNDIMFQGWALMVLYVLFQERNGNGPKFRSDLAVPMSTMLKELKLFSWFTKMLLSFIIYGLFFREVSKIST